MKSARCVAAAVALALAGCAASPGAGGDAGPKADGGSLTDGGPDAGRDAGIDAGADAGRDAGVDGGADAGRDAGPTEDAGFDGGGRTDGGRDAGPGEDAGPTEDAGRDAGSWTFQATTTLASLTQNDSSACGSDAGPCTEAWGQTHTVKYGSGSSYSGQTLTVTGFWDNAVAPGPSAPGSPYGRVSKVPMSALLPGQGVPVWVETQNWWGGGNGHIDNGEVSANATQMANEVADQESRGIAGQVVDWYGPGTTADQALPAIRANAEASGGSYEFAVMIDKGYFDSCGNTVACLNSALSYLAANDFPSSAYQTDSAGHPLVYFFINSYYPSQYPILSDPGISYQNSEFVMYEPNGFPGNDPPNTEGEYAWVNPGDGAPYTQSSGSAGTFSWQSDFGFKDLDSFFSNAANNPGSLAVSEAHKGFDDNLASWSLNRVIDQQCGLTWLQTFDHTGSFGGSSSYQGNLNFLGAGHHLDLVMVDTWDDYEEGTEMETGIDDCLTSLAVSLSGATLSWTPTFGQDPMNSAVTGSEATVHHYSVYLAAPGGTDVMWLADVAPPTHQLDVSKLGLAGGPWVFYVQAVGQPSIVNTLGGPSGSYTF
ncbi:MAG TPA: hypothetical protein VMB91_03710 [Solirubrobacteraceae bacterium]|nr:hypothetical protein [Solirubrobacteraceae bacterium]